MSDKKQPKVKKCLLSPKMKQFCREYVKFGDDQTKAVLKVYDFKDKDQAVKRAKELLEDRRICTYIEYIRQEVENNMPDSVSWMVNKAVEAVEIGLQKGQAASVAKCLEVLDKMRGTGRRKNSLNLAHYDTLRDKLNAVYDAYADGELGTDQCAMLLNSVKNVEAEQLVEEVERMKEAFKNKEEANTDETS